MLILKYLQLPFHFEVNRLQQEVKQLANHHWLLHYQHKQYEGEWSAIPLRSIHGATDSILVSPEENAVYKDTAFLAASPYCQEVLSHFQCPLLAVRLLKLNAGAIIKEHRDADLCFEKGEIRLHIPVTTHPNVEFYLDQERMHLREGECWYMNFNLPHTISNNSDIDRVHLVIDAVVNDWVKELFAQTSPHKKEIEEAGYDDATKQQIIAQLRQLNTETANRLADEMEAAG
jgi:quercetin dioxygenase-like cupin family protein